MDELVARRRALNNADAGSSVGGSGAAGGGGGLARTGAEVGQRENERRLIQTELNMVRSFEAIDRDHRGYDVANGLRAVVDTLASYPGRKTIVFFSEGLPVSPSLSANLDTLIDAANRANVTTYAIDAHGLRAKSTSENVRKEITVFGEERLIMNATGVTKTDQPLSMSFERVEDMMQLDSRAGLARLSEDTGGFLIEGSNDLSSAFRRIDEDHQFHYLLTYAPTNAAFDGKFRTIRVDVRRPGTQAFARKGYRALNGPRRADADGYDLPALTLLERTPPPNAFPMQAAGFSFPDAARPGLTPILVHVDTNVLRFDVDDRQGTYSAQAVIAVRLRDNGGREVQKLTQQYLVAGDAKDVDRRQARRHHLLPRDRSRARRLHDGGHRLRRRRAVRQRSCLDADRACASIRLRSASAASWSSRAPRKRKMPASRHRRPRPSISVARSSIQISVSRSRSRSRTSCLSISRSTETFRVRRRQHC